jgi:hypothetical protein
MPHWAELDDDNAVLRVIVCDADDGADGAKHPPAFCTETLGGTWVRTYYDTKGRTYAGIGYRWDPKLADFKPPSTKDNAMSWTRNTGTVTKADAAKALLALAPAKTDEPGADAEVQAQLQSVADVLPALLATVGRADDQVQVEVAGHANPEREPVDDVSDEVLYVTVRCIPAKPAEVPTPE